MREIIEIDDDKCDGCGECVPNCPEGALKIIDGKARLVSDSYCDGLGECLNHCPKGAIRITKRKADEYDEKKVMKESIVPKGKNTIKAHLEHLREHGAKEYLKQAEEFLQEQGIDIEEKKCGCPYSQPKELSVKNEGGSALNNWPVQLHLLSSEASFLDGGHLLIAADCTAYAFAGFYKRFMKDKVVAIACPKLDEGLDSYEEKLSLIMKKASSITIVIMEVPCCSGLLRIAERAHSKSGRDIQLKKYVIGINGEIKSEGCI